MPVTTKKSKIVNRNSAIELVPNVAKEKLKDTNPQHRLVQPSEIASVVAFACGETCPALTNEDIQINAGALW